MPFPSTTATKTKTRTGVKVAAAFLLMTGLAVYAYAVLPVGKRPSLQPLFKPAAPAMLAPAAECAKGGMDPKQTVSGGCCEGSMPYYKQGVTDKSTVCIVPGTECASANQLAKNSLYGNCCKGAQYLNTTTGYCMENPAAACTKSGEDPKVMGTACCAGLNAYANPGGVQGTAVCLPADSACAATGMDPKKSAFGGCCQGLKPYDKSNNANDADQTLVCLVPGTECANTGQKAGISYYGECCKGAKYLDTKTGFCMSNPVVTAPPTAACAKDTEFANQTTSKKCCKGDAYMNPTTTQCYQSAYCAAVGEQAQNSMMQTCCIGGDAYMDPKTTMCYGFEVGGF